MQNQGSGKKCANHLSFSIFFSFLFWACHATCGILVTQPEIEPENPTREPNLTCLLQGKDRILTTGLPGNSLTSASEPGLGHSCISLLRSLLCLPSSRYPWANMGSVASSRIVDNRDLGLLST